MAEEELVNQGAGGSAGGFERRRRERRSGIERRGVLRWDPRAAERERRSGTDRRQAAAAQARQ